MTFRTVLASGTTALLCACAAAGPAPNPLLAREQKAVSIFKKEYKHIVMGTDVQDRTLVLYVDVENLDSMDESAEDTLKAQALDDWKTIWSANHPHHHALLRFSMRDYYGNQIYASAVRV